MKVPATFAVAFSCVELSAVPCVIAAGADHFKTGVACVTTRVVVVVAELKLALSAGVKVAVSVVVPAFSIAPAAGEYVKDPCTFAVAFSCAADNGVPKTTGVVLAQERIGVTGILDVTLRLVAAVAVA